MINEQSFYDIVDIKEEEKESARAFLNNKGITEHIRMAEYLSAFINRKPTYSEVATAFRYDKRIRRIIYKYLGLLEERIRAYLADRYETIGVIPNYQPKLIKKQKHLREMSTSTNTYDFVNELLFSNLINIVKKLGDNEKELVFSGRVENKDLDAVVELRNAISHNRTILNYHYSIMSHDVGGASFVQSYALLLYGILPFNIRSNFMKEIKEASIQKDNTIDVQVEWKPLTYYIIKIEA